MYALHYRRFFVCKYLVSLVFFIILSRFIYLYSNKHTYYSQGQKIRSSIRTFNGERGKILDSNYNIIATNKKIFTVGLDPQFLVKEDIRQLKKLSILLKCSFSDLKKLWRNPPSNRWKKLSENVAPHTYNKIKQLKIKGLYGIEGTKRLYACPTTLSPILGFLNKDGIPVLGVEKWMNFYLKGQDGLIETEKDGKQQEIHYFRKSYIKPKSGHSVQLTIDYYIQYIVENVLKEAQEDYSPIISKAIVSKIDTGEVLAIANIPSFDSNNFSKFDPKYFHNKVLTDIYEPGSIFKVIPISAALNEGIVNIRDKFDCQKITINHRGRKLHLPKDWKDFATLTVKEILQHSSNRGTVQIAAMLGENRLFDYSKKFGFGKQCFTNKFGESHGILPHFSKWNLARITRIPMGHAIGCTLMQMHCAMSVIANKGNKNSPLLIKRIFDEKGNIVRTFHSQQQTNIIKQKTSKLMCNLLTLPKTSKAFIDGQLVAGKSGTTQKIVNGKYSNSKHISSFSGFFPSNNPMYLITLALDEPKCPGTAYGAQIAAPIFKKIAQEIIAYKKIKPLFL